MRPRAPRPPRPPAMVSEHVRLPPALLGLVDALARAEGRSRSDMLRELVRRGFQVSPPPAT